MTKFFIWASGTPGELHELKNRPDGYNYLVSFTLSGSHHTVYHEIYCVTLQHASLVLEQFKPIANESTRFQLEYIGEVKE